jgi:DNA polymerase-4
MTGLTASVGLAPTKMAAKIASDLEKPDGMVEVAKEKVLDFLWPLDVRRIWGLGKKSEEILAGMGIKTIGDLARADIKNLKNIFGKNGEYFWQLANGVDERTVDAETDAKSVSNETTFDLDTSDDVLVESALMALCEKVSARLRRDGLKCKTITLKIRLEGFFTYTRSLTVPEPTNFTDSLYKVIKDLYNNFSTRNKKVRLVGVRASNLASSSFQESLFTEQDDKRLEAIHGAIDAIKGKFGEDSIYRAKSMPS